MFTGYCLETLVFVLKIKICFESACWFWSRDYHLFIQVLICMGLWLQHSIYGQHFVIIACGVCILGCDLAILVIEEVSKTIHHHQNVYVSIRYLLLCSVTKQFTKIFYSLCLLLAIRNKLHFLICIYLFVFIYLSIAFFTLS